MNDFYTKKGIPCSKTTTIYVLYVKRAFNDQPTFSPVKF